MSRYAILIALIGSVLVGPGLVAAPPAEVAPLTDRSFDILFTGVLGETQDCFTFESGGVLQPQTLPAGEWTEIDLFFFSVWFAYGGGLTSYAFVGIGLDDGTLSGIGAIFVFGIPNFGSLSGIENSGC